jgi:hypothetical protein
VRIKKHKPVLVSATAGNASMPLEITAGAALLALEALHKWLVVPFPVSDAFALGRVIARLKLQPDLAAAETARAAAARAYGTDVGGGQSRVPPDRQAAFMADYGPVANTPLKLDVPRLPVSILEYARTHPLEMPVMTPLEMMALEPFWENPQ